MGMDLIVVAVKRRSRDSGTPVESDPISLFRTRRYPLFEERSDGQLSARSGGVLHHSLGPTRVPHVYRHQIATQRRRTWALVNLKPSRAN